MFVRRMEMRSSAIASPSVRPSDHRTVSFVFVRPAGPAGDFREPRRVNLRALALGADAVGGDVQLRADSHDQLAPRIYLANVAGHLQSGRPGLDRGPGVGLKARVLKHDAGWARGLDALPTPLRGLALEARTGFRLGRRRRGRGWGAVSNPWPTRSSLPLRDQRCDPIGKSRPIAALRNATRLDRSCLDLERARERLCSHCCSPRELCHWVCIASLHPFLDCGSTCHSARFAIDLISASGKPSATACPSAERQRSAFWLGPRGNLR